MIRGFVLTLLCSTFVLASQPANFHRDVIDISEHFGRFKELTTATTNLRFRVMFPNAENPTFTCLTTGSSVQTDLTPCLQGTTGCKSHMKIEYTGMTHTNYLAVTSPCDAADVFTSAKRSKLTEAFQIATSYVSNAIRANTPLPNMNLKSFYDNCDPAARYCGFLKSINHVFCGANFYYPYPAEGYAETDFVLYVDVQPIPGNTFAIAGACIAESSVAAGRPLVGHVTVNARKITDTVDPRDLAQTLTHEIFHALGFVGTSWGTKKTAYQERVNNGIGVSVYKHTDATVIDKVKTQFQCTTEDSTRHLGGEFDSGDYYAVDHACDDANNIPPQFGSLCSITTVNGVKYASPKSAAVEAMRLQMAGSHWSERLYGSELMTPYALGYGSGERLPVSAITLAALESLGMYTANYNYADILLYGRGAGCDLMAGLPTSWPAPYYCNESVPACSVDYTSAAKCTITNYANDLPLANAYFSNRKLGGSLQQDYYPLIQAVSLSSCLEPSTASNSAANSECMGSFCTFPQQFSQNSRCFMSQVRASSSAAATAKPACFQSECTKNGNSWTLRVSIQNVWYNCAKAGDAFGPGSTPTPSLNADATWKQGSFIGTGICPDPTRFCDFNTVCTALHTCNGHGYCNGQGQCVCNADPVMGYWTGTNCNQCASGWSGTATGCLRKEGTSSDACVIELLTGIQCNGRGKCRNDNSGLCDCSEFNSRVGAHWQGDKCEVCEIGYDTATCTQVVCQNSQCGHGACGSAGTCVCDSSAALGYWTGSKCDTCQTAYMGATCKTARVYCPSSCVGVSTSSTGSYDCTQKAYPIFSLASTVDQCGCPTQMSYPSCTSGTARGPSQCPSSSSTNGASRSINCGNWLIPSTKFNQCNCTDPDTTNICRDPFGCTVDETPFQCSAASVSAATTRCASQTCPGSSTWTPQLDCSKFPFLWSQKLRSTECGCLSPPLPTCTAATSGAPMIRFVTSPPLPTTPKLDCSPYAPLTASNNPYFKSINAYITANGGASSLESSKKFKFDESTGTVYLNCFSKFPDFEIEEQTDGCGFAYPTFKCYPGTAIPMCSCSSIPFSVEVDCQGASWPPVISWQYPHPCNCPTPKVVCAAGTSLACKCPPTVSPTEVDCKGRKLAPTVVNDKCNPCPECLQPTAFVCKAGTDQPSMPATPAPTAAATGAPSGGHITGDACTNAVSEDLSIGCPQSDIDLVAGSPDDTYPTKGLLICPQVSLEGGDINAEIGVSQFVIDFVNDWRANKPCCAKRYGDSADAPLYLAMWCDDPAWYARRAHRRHASALQLSDTRNVCGGKGAMFCAPYACMNGLCRQDCETDTHCTSTYKCCGRTCVSASTVCTPGALGCTSNPSACAPYVCGASRTQVPASGALCGSSCSSDESCAVGFVCTVSLLPMNTTIGTSGSSTGCPVPESKPVGQCVPQENAAPGVSCFCHSSCGAYVCGQNRNQVEFVLARCRSSCSDDLHCNEGFKCTNAVCVAGAGAPTTPVRDSFCSDRAFDFCTPYACGTSINVAPVVGSVCRNYCLSDSHCMPLHTCVSGANGKGVCTPSADYTNGLQKDVQDSQTLTWESRPGVFFKVAPFSSPAAAPSSSVKCASNPDMCFPYRCGQYGYPKDQISSVATCQTACNFKTDCAVGHYCSEHLCQPKRSLGTQCSSVEQCASGFCVDGICCTSSCTEKCKTCSNMGVCTWVTVGTDPAGVCPSCNACQYDSTKTGDARLNSRVCAPSLPGLDVKQDCSGHGLCDAVGSCACDRNQNGQGFWGGKKCDKCEKGFFMSGAAPCTESTATTNVTALRECQLQAAANRTAATSRMRVLDAVETPKLVIVRPLTRFDGCDCSDHGRCNAEGRCECSGHWHGAKCEFPGGQEHLHLQYAANERRAELEKRHLAMNTHLSSSFHSLQTQDVTPSTTATCGGVTAQDGTTLPSAVKGTSVARQYASKVLEVSNSGSNAKQSPDQVLGKPDVFPRNIVSDLAWTPSQRSTDSTAESTQSIVIRVLEPVYASSIEIYETYTPGSILKLEVREANKASATWVTVFSTSAMNAALPNMARIFAPTITRVNSKIQDVRVTFRGDMPTTVQLDAIAVLGFARSDMTFCPGDMVNTIGEIVPCGGNGYCSPLGCECFAKYAGPQCNYCAFGYSGDDCDVPFSAAITTGGRLCKMTVFEEMSKYSASAEAATMLLTRWVLANQRELQSAVVPNGKIYAATRITSPRLSLGAHSHLHINIGLLLADIPLEMGSNTGIVISLSSDQSRSDQRVIFLKHYDSFQGLNMIGEEAADAMDTLDLYVAWSTNSVVVTTEVWPAGTSYRHAITSLLIEECTYPGQ